MTNIDMRHLMTIAEAPPVSQRREPTISPPGSTPAPAATSSAPADAATALTQALQALQAQNLTPDQIKAVLTQWKQELSKTVAAPTPAPAQKPANTTNSQITVGSTINRPEGQFMKTATGWVSKTTGRPVIPGKAKALDKQMMAVLQKRGLAESHKPVHVTFVRAAKKKVKL